MFVSKLVCSIHRFYTPDDKPVSVYHYRRRIWLTAFLGCGLFWLTTGLIINQLTSC